LRLITTQEERELNLGRVIATQMSSSLAVSRFVSLLFLVFPWRERIDRQFHVRQMTFLGRIGSKNAREIKVRVNK
jgi:hypothetical protein